MTIREFTDFTNMLRSLLIPLAWIIGPAILYYLWQSYVKDVASQVAGKGANNVDSQVAGEGA